ncbi:protein angel homolog 1 isoform X2 [Antennarius striatus]|uniref:protein angel homolog 1 isoform X2 n=1 Tax=Antennarius striatus TaxID=241820 RepID=UPI0035B3E4CC
MIGTVLFHVLYPLSRYLSSRLAESSKKDSPPAVFDGTTVWDGDTVPIQRFTQAQTTPLDQPLDPSCGTLGEKKERIEKRMNEPGMVNEGNIMPLAENERLMVVQHEEVEDKAALGMREVQPAVKEREAVTISGNKQEREGPKQRDGEIVQPDVFHLKLNFNDECVFSSEDTNPEVELIAKSKCLQINSNADSTYYAVQKKIKMPNTQDPIIIDEPSTQRTTFVGQEPIQTPTVEESVMSAGATSEVIEFWDEYDQMHGGSSAKMTTASHVSNKEGHDAQTSWHFPAGAGLANEVQYPLWQFPTMSYYPQINPTAHMEVEWRVWQESDESAPAVDPARTPVPSTKASMDFTVMSYNILAEDLLEDHQDLYPHCPLEVLDWNYRCNVILEEILKWTPDILCLQEVQENHYHEQLCPALSEMGYKCVYKRRTGTKTDGCATCYLSSSFSEISVTPLEFFRPETELLDRHNVGIVLLLRPVLMRGSDVKATGSPLCVANTHLLFNPRRGEVKLAQLAIMLAEIDRVVQSCKAEGENCNLILCGDFNSVPHMPLYQLITTGELYFQGLPAWMVSGQEDLSHKTHCYRLFAPLWPSCLGISDNCQYVTGQDALKSQKLGKYQYSHEFLLQLRFCPATFVRPLDLELIPGVTDNTPDASRETYDKRFRHTVRHRLDLESVYKHILPGSGSPEVTSLHSEVGATVDYIFYNPRRTITSRLKGCLVVNGGSSQRYIPL